ncbi:MAG TPA: hypothetical protein VII84_05405, partial [Acidimicrobiales bacterium]
VLKDPLVLNGYPPKSADVRLVISTGQEYTIDANVNMNFVTDAVEANLRIPMFFSATPVDLRFVDNHLYLGSPNLSSIIGAPWIGTKASLPSLFGLSLELTKPDIPLITGFSRERTSKSGYSTTYTFQRDNFILSSPSSSPVKMPVGATLRIGITVGSQGEVTASTLSLVSKTMNFSVSATVLSYNQPAQIAAPSSSQVKQENSSLLHQLLGTSPLANLLSPQNLANLGKVQVN